MNLFSALFVLFVALKLTGAIDWSWWTVCTPLLVGLLLATVCGVTAAVAVDARRREVDWRRHRR